MASFYFVSTPIGNLGDISHRALTVLGSADIIFCEDTRHSLKLLHHYGIQKQLESFHDYSSEAKLERIRSLLEQGRTLAYISDAGTPLISDPGFEIVRYFHDHNMTYDVVPGANAILPALILSGFPSDRFLFSGFFPRKVGDIHHTLSELESSQATLIFYESPKRIKRTVGILADQWPDREVAIVKEITKIHQRAWRGLPGELTDTFSENEKGEFVLLIAPPHPHVLKATESELKAEFNLLLSCDIPRKQATRFLAKKYNMKGKQLYQQSMDW